MKERNRTLGNIFGTVIAIAFLASVLYLALNDMTPLYPQTIQEAYQFAVVVGVATSGLLIVLFHQIEGLAELLVDYTKGKVVRNKWNDKP